MTSEGARKAWVTRKRNALTKNKARPRRATLARILRELEETHAELRALQIRILELRR